MIKYNYEVSVNENRAKLNKDIFLFRGNRNIHYYFSIKGARFAFEKEGDLIENANAIYAAVTVIKPNNVEVASAIAKVENGLIHLKVTEDLIDEEVEIGDFDLVFDLFDDSDGAVTIPKIKGQFHVQERPCTTSIGTLSGNVNVVNQAVVDLAIATQENEQLIVVDDDGKYVKTTWVKGDKISIERLNKIEEGIEKNSTQYKDIANDLELDNSNNLHLINKNGEKVGNGVTLSMNSGGGNDSNYSNLCTFTDAYVAWCNNETFPIAFYGDSTFFGTNTSSGNTFCDVLQTLLRQECGGNATIYRVAVAGTALADGVNGFESYFGTGQSYANTKMIGIGYGINDRLGYNTLKDYKNGVYEKVETLIKKCYEKGIQPFLVTSQATSECGVDTTLNSYKLRDSNSMNVCANEAKKELAQKYNVPLVDLNKFTELFLKYSSLPVNTIISDRLHFGDEGHKYEAGYLFSNLVPRVKNIYNKHEYIINYSDQHLKNAIPEDKISYGGDFKVYSNYTKSDSNDLKIMDAYIFVVDKKCTLFAYKNSADSKTYVKIDSVKYNMNETVIDLGDLDLGLHHLEVYTGDSDVCDFSAFVINNENFPTSSSPVSVTSVELNKTTATLSQYKSTSLKATISPKNATNTSVTWNCNNSNVNLNASGLNCIVTGVAVGESIITCTTNDGNKVAQCTVTVVGGSSELTELCNTLSINGSPYDITNDSFIPATMMPGYTQDNPVCSLSEKVISKIIIKFTTTGKITIGKVKLSQFGKNQDIELLDSAEFNIESTGDQTISLNLVLGKNETIAIGKKGDTAKPKYSAGTTTAIATKDAFKGGIIPAIQLICAIYGY